MWTTTICVILIGKCSSVNQFIMMKESDYNGLQRITEKKRNYIEIHAAI